MLRCRIHDEVTANFELQKLLLSALFGFGLGVTGNVITFFLLNRDGHTRRLERQTKKLAFWKSFNELLISKSAILPTTQLDALQLRYRKDLQEASDSAMGWDRRATRGGMAFGLLAVVLLLAVCSRIPMFFQLLLLRDPRLPSRLSAWPSWLLQVALLSASWWIVFRPAHNWFRDKELAILRKTGGELKLWLLFKLLMGLN